MSPMSQIAVTRPTMAGDLGYRDVGRAITVSTDDANVRGTLWGVEFKTGVAKVVVKSSNGLLFFNLGPDAVLYLDPEPQVSSSTDG